MQLSVRRFLLHNIPFKQDIKGNRVYFWVELANHANVGRASQSWQAFQEMLPQSFKRDDGWPLKKPRETPLCRWNFSLAAASCKGIRIPQSGKFSLMESGIRKNSARGFGVLGFEIRNTAQGIRNPLTIGICNPSITDKEPGLQLLEPEIYGVESRIQDCIHLDFFTY